MAGDTVKNVMLASFLFLLAPAEVYGQSLDTRTAIYILAGIAGLYTLITCFCFLLTICICCKARRKPSKKYLKYLHSGEKLGDVTTQLSPIYESPELESPATVNEPGSTYFENKYTEDYEEDKKDSEIVSGFDKEAAVFVNKLAFDFKHGHELKIRDSPLARHTPKILNHPIKGPYSDDSSSDESEADAAPVTQVPVPSGSGSSSKEKQHSKCNEPIKRVPAGRKAHDDLPSPFTTPKSLKKETPSINDVKTEGQLRMRKFDSASYAGEEGKKIVPLLKSEQTMAEKSTRKDALPQGNEHQVDKPKVLLEPPTTPKTSPLPRSGQTKTTGSDKTVTLSKLHAELSSVAEKWYYLGIQLKVSNKTLSVIRLINKSNEDVCLMRVCEEWLMQQKKSNIVPEWSTVIAVLRSRVISATALADELHQKYCCNDVEVDSDEEEQTSKSYTWIN